MACCPSPLPTYSLKNVPIISPHLAPQKSALSHCIPNRNVLIGHTRPAGSRYHLAAIHESESTPQFTACNFQRSAAETAPLPAALVDRDHSPSTRRQIG